MYQKLLNKDIDTIEKLCHTNLTARKFCLTQKFWTDKFNQDRLPIIKNNLGPRMWVLEYKNVANAKFRVNQIFTIADEQLPNYSEIVFIFEKEYIHDLLPQEFGTDSKLNRQTLIIILNSHSKHYIEYSYRIPQDKRRYTNSDSADDETITNLLFLIFYYYPDVDPVMTSYPQLLL